MKTALDARLRARTLDRDIAVGIAPWRSPVHAARYDLLVSRRRRRFLADALRQILHDAREPLPVWQISAAIPPSRVAVRDCVPQIERVIGTLEADGPVHASGMVRLRRLLSDGAGPMYEPARAAELPSALGHIERWLSAAE
jgi:hypothetical protein